MEAYQIILLIVVLLAFFYLATLVYVFGEIYEFKARLRRGTNGLNLLLSQRLDTIQTIVELLKKNSVSISEDDRACFENLDQFDFSKPNEEIIRVSVAAIKEATSRLQSICQNNQEIVSGEAFQLHFGLLEDLERNYRSLIGAYNANVIGYNYWIKVPTIGFIARLFRNRPRTLLN